MRLNVLILIYISLPLPEGMETRQTFAVGENKPEIWIPLKNQSMVPHIWINPNARIYI